MWDSSSDVTVAVTDDNEQIPLSLPTVRRTMIASDSGTTQDACLFSHFCSIPYLFRLDEERLLTFLTGIVNKRSWN